MAYVVPEGSIIVMIPSQKKLGVREPNGDLVELSFTWEDKDELCEATEKKRYPASETKR